MNRDFHNDDFERLLREKSNEFRLYPSKRVWHSIYNNIHPGRKWPSVAMTITLITSLFLVGYLNTRNTSTLLSSSNIELHQKIIAGTISSNFISPFNNFNAGNSAVTLNAADNDIEPSTMPKSVANLSVNTGANIIVNNNIENVTKHSPKGLKANQTLLKNNNLVIANEHSNSSQTANTNNEIVNQINPAMHSISGLTHGIIDKSPDFQTMDVFDDARILTYTDKVKITPGFDNDPWNDFAKHEINEKMLLIIGGENSTFEKNLPEVNNSNLISTQERSWIENYALYNRPAAKKWVNKLALQVYATPSVVYRVLSNEHANINTITATPFAISTFSQGINSTVNQKPSIGLEVGTGVQYSILKGLKLKAGLQLNFTRYNSDAFQNSHPVTTMLTMHDFKTNTSYQVSRATPFSSKSGLESVILHNETFQISLPFGADIKLIGNDNIQWNIGATIQPTFVAGGKSYLISSDRLNYVKESSMLNRWNLNAGLETNITYKAKGLSYQLGPQFRTQLFSTNSKNYAVEERLVNFGLKFGVSKIIK